MQKNRALQNDTEQSNLYCDEPSEKAPLGGLFGQLLSYIERECSYSEPIIGYLYVTGANNTLSLYDSHNVAPHVSSKCITINKGECHCGAVLSSKDPCVISYTTEEEIIQYKGICPDSHIAFPIWYEETLVGLVYISLPNSDCGAKYSRGNYPAIFDLVSGYLETKIYNHLLQKKINRTGLLLDATNGMVLDLDNDGKVTNIQSQTNLLNVNIGKLIGYRLSDHFAERDKQEIDNALAKLSAGSCNKIRGEHEFKNRYGESQTIELSLYLCTDDDQCDGFVVVCRDIDQFKKSEARFTALLQSAPDAILIADENGRIVIVNKRCIKLFGYDEAELAGQHVEMLLPKQQRDTHKEVRDNYSRIPYARLMSEKSDLTVRHKSGRLIPVEISLSPLKQKDNNLTIAIIKDITHRKNNEKELERLAFVTEFSPNPIMEIDTSGRVIYANKNAALFSLDKAVSSIYKNLKKQAQGTSADDITLDVCSRNIEVSSRVFQQKVRYAQASNSYFVYAWETTEDHEISNKLSVKAKTDSLTGLSNRIALIASLKDAINTSNTMAVSHTILCIDIDDFKTIGSSLPQAGSDALLKMLACLLKDNVRRADTPARMRDNQFTVLLAFCPVSRGYQVAEKIKAELAGSTLTWQQKDYTFTASIGVVEVIKSFESYHEILESAESACRQARRNGGNGICLYNKRIPRLHMD